MEKIRICDFPVPGKFGIYAQIFSGNSTLYPQSAKDNLIILDPYAEAYYDVVNKRGGGNFDVNWRKLYTDLSGLSYKESAMLSEEAARLSILNFADHYLIKYELLKPTIKQFINDYIDKNPSISYIQILLEDSNGLPLLNALVIQDNIKYGGS